MLLQKRVVGVGDRRPVAEAAPRPVAAAGRGGEEAARGFGGGAAMPGGKDKDGTMVHAQMERPTIPKRSRKKKAKVEKAEGEQADESVAGIQQPDER